LTRPIQRLRALAGVDDHLGQLEIVELRIRLDLGSLGFKAYSAVGLLVSADP
jgi:hypothetical protein